MNKKKLKVSNEKLKFKIKCSFLLLITLILPLFLSFTAFPSNSVDPLFPNEDSNGVIKNFKRDNDIEFKNLKSSGASEWWNDSFRYRVVVNFKEMGYFNRTNEPVDVFLSFENEECHKNTIRVVENNSNEIAYQLWNSTMHDSTYIESCTITFLVTVEINKNLSYYIYYSPNDENGKILNPNQRYIDESGFTSELQGPRLSINTTEFNLELEEGRCIYNFSKDGINYHTNYSLTPWIKNNRFDSKIHHPDSIYGGAINDWLVIGPFDYLYDNDFNKHVTNDTDNNYHFDMTNYYVEGDNATGGTVPEAFLNNSKQWEYWDFKDYGAYNWYDGYMDLNSYYGTSPSGDPPRRVCAYASAYIRSPVDLNEVYLKVGSDDGIQVFRDGVRIHYNHIPRGPRPDRDLIGPLTFEKDRWYNFIVLNEEIRGHWGFNFRFSNSSILFPNDPGEDTLSIKNLDIAMAPPLPSITSISEVENGPVFSRYEITWENSSNMKTWDSITIYNGYNCWKTERTFWWGDEQKDTSFSILNTFYDNNSFDSYYYDGKTQDGLSNPLFKVQNYSIVRNSAGGNYESLGIFISDIIDNNPLTNLTSVNWSIDCYDSMINFRPGNETDLDNNGTHEWPTDSQYNVTLKYWEYLDLVLGSPAEANDTFVGLFNSLKNPLIQNKSEVESSVLDLTLNLKDHDGYPAKNIIVNIYNSSDLSEDYRINQSTDENGCTQFNKLPKGNYTFNFSYQPYGIEKRIFVRINHNISLDRTKTVDVPKLNLTSLHLHFSYKEDPSINVTGAIVSFYRLNGGGREQIGNETTDINGNVSFYWKNMSKQEANISIAVKFLNEPRKINNSYDENGFNFLNYTFESMTYDEISVFMDGSTDPHETFLDIIGEKFVYNKTKGVKINFTANYWYSCGAEKGNLTGATVVYDLIDISTGLTVRTGTFIEVDPNNLPGVYNITIDSGDEDIKTGITYQLEISATKPSYSSATNTTAFHLLEIPAELTTDNHTVNVYWNKEFTIFVYYNDTLNNKGLNESTVTYNVLENLTITGNLNEEDNDGWYNITLNSNVFQETGEYSLRISASKQNYAYEYLYITVNVNDISTNLNSNLDEIEVVWNKNFSISVVFNDTLNNYIAIYDATVSYEALGAIEAVEGHFINEGNGKYSLNLNTSLFLYTGNYFLKIIANKKNYESQTIEIPLEILPIPTLINGNFSIITEIDVRVGIEELLYFEYTLQEGNIGLTAATATYQWKEEGGNFSPGTLDNTTDSGTYVLDFNTEEKELGTYTLVISISKTNYETRSATIIINIIEREFVIKSSEKSFSNNSISIISGNPLEFIITLKDKTADSPLTGATVYATFQGKRYYFTDKGNGNYSISIPATDIPVAFFTAQPLPMNITIEKKNFTAVQLTITLFVGLAEGPISGFPTFYFFMIVGSIAAVVGSLVSYRTIQVARIPKFVKKMNAVEKVIQQRKSFPDSLSYPPKEEFIVKKLGDKWALLGLSLKDILVKDNKVKKKLSKKVIKSEGGDK